MHVCYIVVTCALTEVVGSHEGLNEMYYVRRF